MSTRFESTTGIRDHLPFSTTTRLWIALVLVETYLVVAYFAVTPAEPTAPVRYLAYPFVWVNVAIWAIWRSRPNAGTRRHRLLAAVVASGYFMLVMGIPGNLALGTAPGLESRVAMVSPGWGPLVAVDSPWLRAYLVPFEVVGYAALSYLVYANALSVSRGALGGVLGVATCVGCTVPVLTPLVGALGGPTTGLATTAYQWSYDFGTALFVLAVALLAWSHDRSANDSRDA